MYMYQAPWTHIQTKPNAMYEGGSVLLWIFFPHAWGCSKNTYELKNLRALKFSLVSKIYIFQCMGKIFCVEFQSTLWNSTQNIIPTHWKMWCLYNIEILRALMFKSSYEFLKRPLVRMSRTCAMSAISDYFTQEVGPIHHEESILLASKQRPFMSSIDQKQNLFCGMWRI